VGKATIAGETGEGLYTVNLDYGTDYVNQRVQQLQTISDDTAAAITGGESELSEKQTVLDDALAELDAAIAQLRAADDETRAAARAAVESASTAAQDARVEVEKVERIVSKLTLRKSQADEEIARLQEIALTEQRDVWCATYTENATGDVSTIEVNAEQPTILLAPEAPEYSVEYGDFRHRQAMTGAATYYNAALLPGWQKHRPTYRVGIISDIDTTLDTCNVLLVPALSSAQDLDINRETFLADVPVQYLECNAQAFEDGDRVVVQFEGQSWDSPKVIGFEKEPRTCGEFLWVVGSDLPTGGAPGVTSYLLNLDGAVLSQHFAPTSLFPGREAVRVNNDEVLFSRDTSITAGSRPVITNQDGSIAWTETYPTGSAGGLAFAVDRKTDELWYYTFAPDNTFGGQTHQAYRRVTDWRTNPQVAAERREAWISFSTAVDNAYLPPIELTDNYLFTAQRISNGFVSAPVYGGSTRDLRMRIVAMNRETLSTEWRTQEFSDPLSLVSGFTFRKISALKDVLVFATVGSYPEGINVPVPLRFSTFGLTNFFVYYVFDANDGALIRTEEQSARDNPISLPGIGNGLIEVLSTTLREEKGDIKLYILFKSSEKVTGPFFDEATNSGWGLNTDVYLMKIDALTGTVQTPDLLIKLPFGEKRYPTASSAGFTPQFLD